MSFAPRKLVFLVVIMLVASCGGGGGGDGGTTSPPTGGGSGGGGTTPEPLDPATYDFRRHVNADYDFSVLYPAGWQTTLGLGNQGDVVVSFRQAITGLVDTYREYIEISVGPKGTLARSQSLSNIDEIEINQISTHDLEAREVIFDADLAGASVPVRFLETTFDVDDLSYSLTFYGQRGVGNLREDGFDNLLPIIRHAVQEFVVGVRVIENDDGLDPGQPAVGTDGDRYLAVACRDESSQQYFSGSIVGMLFQTGNTRLGTEFQIDDEGIPCADLSPSVSWDGTNYLVTYIREIAFPIIRNGQTYQNEQLALVAKRVDATGAILDADPIVISTEGSDQATNIFKSKPAADASSFFDGTRHIAVWEQIMDSDVFDQDHFRQIHGAFVDTNGVVSDNFVIFDGINGLFQTLNYAHWRPDAAASSDRIMVVLGPRGEPSTPREPTPVYAQFVDFTGTKMHPDPILVRDDLDEKRPRYPQVEFDGENFIVAWIQGVKSTSSINDGFFGISARKVTPDGMLLNGDAGSEGFVVAEEIEEDREFLEMHRSGDEITVMWGEIGFGAEPGVWGTTFATDLASVGVARPVWGDRSFELADHGPQPDHLAFIHGPTEIVAIWTSSNVVRSWFVPPEHFD